MFHYTIKKVAILGSGVMGSRIACHFANIGVKVLLLDIITPGMETSSVATERNQLVNTALQTAIASNPSPIYTKATASLITTGNFTDNIKEITNCNWIIEAVIEQLEIKQSIMKEVEKYRKPQTLVSSNTSGIPIDQIAMHCSDEFKAHFCGTHFFNPPRYLQLLEIIPTKQTSEEVINFFLSYGEQILGKTTILCKNTPAFIANRIGIFNMYSIFKIMGSLSLSIDEIDKLTGQIMGHPSSATFRTADVVGIDTLLKVASDVYTNCPNDESKEIFKTPTWLQAIVDKKWLGDKTKQGFFKKIKTEQGKSILTLQLQTLEYQPATKVKLPTLETAKSIDNLKERLLFLIKASDKVGQFYRSYFYQLFSYVSFRIPEISNHIHSIDQAMRAGYAWEVGPFEAWDIFGIAPTVEAMKKENIPVAPWVTNMLQKGITSFYTLEKSIRFCYYPQEQKMISITQPHLIILSDLKEKQVWKNNNCKLYDIGDGVVSLSWHTKLNTIGGDVLQGIQTAIQIAEEKYQGLVIANEGPHYSAGANIGIIFMLAVEQDYDEIDMAVRAFQQATMRIRYSSIPVVCAPHGLCLGGGCETILHADQIVAAAETYTGLVEAGVGLIPAGGGTKEFVKRASEELHVDEPDINTFKHRFMSIATAKTSTSAMDAYEIGILKKGHDITSIHPQKCISIAKDAILLMNQKGYTMPVSTPIKVYGRLMLGSLLAGIHVMVEGGYASEHDACIAKKLAYVFCGGDISAPTFVSEQYLLDLEKEAFMSLLGEPKTLQRLESMVKTSKILRN